MKTLINRQLWLLMCLFLCTILPSWKSADPAISKPFAGLLAELPEPTGAVDEAAVARLLSAAKKYQQAHAKRSDVNGTRYFWCSQGPGMDRYYSYDIVLDGVSIASGTADGVPTGVSGNILSAGKLEFFVTADYAWSASGFMWMTLIVDGTQLSSIANPVYVNSASTPTYTPAFYFSATVTSGSEFSVTVGSGQEAP